VVLAFCVAFGVGDESSFACLGIGIEFDCCALLISDFAADVVAGASLVGPAGTVPTTDPCEAVSLAVAAGTCAAGMGETASEQLVERAAARIMIATVPF